MGLGLALARAANAGGGSALHGPAFAFECGASIQGLKRIAWAARYGSKVRSSGLCFSMHGGVADAPCWIRTNDRLLRRQKFGQCLQGLMPVLTGFWLPAHPP